MLLYVINNVEEFYLCNIDKAIANYIVERLYIVILERLKDYNI